MMIIIILLQFLVTFVILTKQIAFPLKRNSHLLSQVSHKQKDQILSNYTDNEFDLKRGLYIDMQIGNPPHIYTLILDTGSTWTWVNEEICEVCIKEYQMKQGFSCKQSNTCQETNIEKVIQYKIGVTSGYFAYDQIGFSNYFSAPNIKFILATLLTEKQMAIKDKNGILGMAPSSKSKNSTSLIKYLKNNKKIDQMMFSIFVSLNMKQDSEFTLGAYTQKYINKQNPEFVVSGLHEEADGYWLINYEDVAASIFRSETNKKNKGLVDSGTSHIVLTTEQFDTFLQALMHKGLYCWVTPEIHCLLDMLSDYLSQREEIVDQIFPNLNIILNENYNLTIQPRYYIDDCNYAFPTGEIGCRLLIASSEDGYNILGQPFLMAYYTVFNEENNTLLFFRSVQTKKYNSDDSSLIIYILEIVLGLLAVAVMSHFLCKAQNNPSSLFEHMNDV